MRGDTAEILWRYARAEMKTYKLLLNNDLQYKSKLSTCIVAHIHQKFVLKNSSSKQSATLRLLSFFSDSIYIWKRLSLSFSLSPSSLASKVCGPSVPLVISLTVHTAYPTIGGNPRPWIGLWTNRKPGCFSVVLARHPEIGFPSGAEIGF